MERRTTRDCRWNHWVTRCWASVLLGLLSGCYDGHDAESGVGGTELVGTGSDESEAPPPMAEPEAESEGDRDPVGDEGSSDGDAPADPEADVVDFRIRPGTGASAWNTEEESVVAYVGQTLRLINDDSAPHILHTFGVPLEHGDTIPPGGSAEYLLLEPYDAGDETPELWDHEAGEPAYFWLRVLARD